MRLGFYPLLEEAVIRLLNAVASYYEKKGDSLNDET